MNKKAIVVVCVSVFAMQTQAQSFGDFLNQAAKVLGVESSSTQNSSSTKTAPASNTQTTTPASGGKVINSSGTSTTTTATGDKGTVKGNTTNTSTTTGGKVGVGTGGASTTTTTTTTSSSNSTGSSSSGGGLGGIIGGVVGAVTGGGGFTEGEAGNAIKQALTQGITNGVNIVSLTNGYYGNNLIKIPFPKEVQVVATTLQSIGAGSLIDKLVLQMNRSAEGAAKEALPIFTNAITQMTVTDAVNIVSNKQSDAATQFLKRVTYNQLKAKFNPKIKGALDKTGTPAIWNTITSTYNKVPFVRPVNTDLTDYVTGKALDGLFIVVGQQEAKIRKDPAAQTTALLQKVFGGK